MVSDDVDDRYVVRAETGSPSPTDAPPTDLYAGGVPVATLSLSFRCRQVRALIRDVPSLAADQLQRLGYTVTAPAETPPENLVSLRGY